MSEWRRKTAKITGLTHINVSLASTAKALDEVVVTALGVTREAKSLNYSRQSVNAEAWQKIVVAI